MFEFPSDFGRYRLTGIAGEGGMATVYRAVLPGPMGFEKRLVVKVIRPALVEDEEFLRALVTEALLAIAKLIVPPVAVSVAVPRFEPLTMLTTLVPAARARVPL